jgi:iron-sulfur cluster repair protein YtfE (RIC family)
VSESNEQALRRVLYGLYAIIKLHLAKEEEIYLPLLEARLGTEEVQRMFEVMKRTAQEAKGILKE